VRGLRRQVLELRSGGGPDREPRAGNCGQNDTAERRNVSRRSRPKEYTLPTIARQADSASLYLKIATSVYARYCNLDKRAAGHSVAA